MVWKFDRTLPFISIKNFRVKFYGIFSRNNMHLLWDKGQKSRSCSYQMHCQCVYACCYTWKLMCPVFTARRLAKRGICRRRVSLCVCLSHSGIVSKRLNIGSRKQRRTIAPWLVFWCQISWRNSIGITPYGGDKCRWGRLKFVTFDEKRAITRKRYKIDA